MGMGKYEVHESRRCSALILLFPLQGPGLVNEHNRDIILDGIDEFTGRADEAVTLGRERDRPFTLGTGKDIKKFFFEHGIVSWKKEKKTQQRGANPSAARGAVTAWGLEKNWPLPWPG
jgi:hypothetical protein